MTELLPAFASTSQDIPKGVTPGFINDLHDPNYHDPHTIDWRRLAQPAPPDVIARHRAPVTGMVEINPRLRV